LHNERAASDLQPNVRLSWFSSSDTARTGKSERHGSPYTKQEEAELYRRMAGTQRRYCLCSRWV
jgi:hypothetical protein